MRTHPLLSLFFITLLAATASFCQSVSAATVTVDPPIPLVGSWSAEWNTNANLEGWSATNANVSVAGGVLSGTATSTDSQVQRANFTAGPNLDLGYNDFMELRVKIPATYTGDITISYGTSTTTGFGASRVITIPSASIPKDGAFHSYRIDVGLESLWRATLRDLRISPLSGAGTNGMAFEIDYLRVGDEPNAPVYQVRTSTECPAAGGTTPVGATLGGGQTVNSMESKHFRFLWNATVAAQPAWTADMPQGTLRNLEEAWQLFVNDLGYRQPNQAVSNPNSTSKFKLNVISWYGGYWAGVNEDYAYLNITPDGLRVDPPTWVIPHELMHCFQFHNNDGGSMPGEWYEFHANYGRERWLQHYSALYPNSSGIDPTHLRSAHLNIGAGREYYLCWPFFQYIDENLDDLPDLGEGTTVKLWQQGGANEYPFMTLERLTPTTSIKDIVGYYARRGATYNYSTKAAIQATLAGFGQPLDNAATSRWQFTDLVQRSDDPTWWRVPYEMAPMQGAYAIHELVVPNAGTAERTVTVKLQGLADSARGADWRASFIAISDGGGERYSTLWGNGSNSITLKANENQLYLSVAGAPATYYYGGADEAAYPYRTHPSKTRFPYEIQVIGASPKQRDSGYVSSTATVAPTVYVGPNARVLGNANVTGNARIEDYAVVTGNAVVSGNAVISGHALVRGSAVVNGNAKVRDWALVEGGTITGSGRVLEHANIKGGTVRDIATAKGSAGSLTGTLSGNAIIDGDYGDFFSGRDVANSVAFGHLPYVGVPDNYLKSLPTGLYVSYDFAAAHESRIRDQYGVTDSFTNGSPTWLASDDKRRGCLDFNGINQFVNLDRSVADLRDFTFTAWVKPLGGTANQTVLWLGASGTRRMRFTPDDGTGHAKFSIVNGGTDQSLTAPAALTPNAWSHVAVTLDGTTGTLYINGTAVASAAIATRADQLLAANTATSPQQNYLARSQGTLTPMFRGRLDDVRFYATPLTAGEIADLQPPTTVAKAGTLYVDLQAGDSSAGATTWLNNGTLGNFTRTGAPAKVADVAGSGYPGVQFDGTNQGYGGPNSVTDIDGSSDRSIEVWAYNPALAEEETTVSWGHRGTVRRNMAFNFGNNTNWGAVTHWGDDVGWGSTPGANAWHHLVYTYDGTTAVKIYLDGDLVNSKTLGGALNTFASEPINIACQRDSANGTRSQFFSGFINTVRVHGGVLTEAQIANNYALGPDGAAPIVEPATVQLISDAFIVDEGGKYASLTVTRTGNVSIPVSVAYATTDGTAVAPADYTTTTGTLSFAANETSKTIDIPIIDDTLIEAEESFTLTLSDPQGGAVLGANRAASVSISDNEIRPVPLLSVADVRVVEGDSGTTNTVFTVKLSEASDQIVMVNYATADGTATAGSDYKDIPETTLTFDAGTTTKTFTVPVTGDTIVEPDETFLLNFSSPVNATYETMEATGTIVNDDAIVVEPTATPSPTSNPLPTPTATPIPANKAPTIDAIANRAAIKEDAAPQTVALTGISAGAGETQTLSVRATSSNPALVPNPIVSYISPQSVGSLTYQPLADQFGTAVITIKVKDNGGTANGGIDTTTRSFTITVTPVNDAPVAQETTLTGNIGEPIAFQLQATDVDSDTLSYQVQRFTGDSSLGGGKLKGQAPDLTFTSFTPGTFSLVFRARDEYGASSNSATITFIISAPAGFTASGIVTSVEPNSFFLVATMVPVPSVEVHLELAGRIIARSATDSNGRYTFYGVSPGKYQVYVDAVPSGQYGEPAPLPYVLSRNLKVQVTKKTLANAQFAIPQVTFYSIWGQVVTKVGGAQVVGTAVTNAIIVLKKSGNTNYPISSTTVNSGGSYVFKYLSRGSFTVGAMDSGLTFARNNVKVNLPASKRPDKPAARINFTGTKTNSSSKASVNAY